MTQTNDSPSVLQRFLRYVVIDTQSAEGVEAYPSTENQKELGKALLGELNELGLADAAMDKHGYVTASLPSNVEQDVPSIGFIAHVDTSPDVSGKDVKPQVHSDYQGGDIPLPGDADQVILAEENPDLAGLIGNDIVTSDGTTLLGADNKAGCAEIVTAVERLVKDPSIPHGKICIGFTCDEEIGRGVDFFNVGAFGADFAYTVDGEAAGEIENETFSADAMNVYVKGRNVHPGYAKGKMINAVKVAAKVIERLPGDCSPETTAKREGYLHPNTMSGGVEKVTINFLMRDFEEEGLKEKEALLEKIVSEVEAEVPGCKIDVVVKEQYRNMRLAIDEEPRVVEYALEAIRRAGMDARLNIVRGGTDGARLSFMGLLTPNLFTGGHNFHGKLEWISVQDMERAVDTIVELAKIWAEKG